ncbi:hypothetical protein ASG31_08640 [Chryseobacterium sp. Leaf404]|uniref:hypothetical protein n=1 Tax=unclassified Chryseobacterium TaxID=2593645 RepID=UPI0007021A49|nr:MULTISPECIES: hypothetical protein [unclassified Chryseobacterium]KQT17466.1 hypothetical protein ASG31_08640 [Chryseobacterium sp. Leaf404]
MEQPFFSISNYKISEQDYLTYLLYDSSKSKKAMTAKVINNILFVIIMLSILIYGNREGFNIEFTIIFSPLAITMFFVRRIMGRNLYHKKLETYVKKNIKRRNNQNSDLLFFEKHIVVSEKASEHKFFFNGIKEITEIKDILFIKVLENNVLIINKMTTQNINILQKFLNGISAENNISYSLDLEWKWN